jgi:hypothetical protein
VGNIEVHLMEKECEGVDWTQLAQDMDQWWDFVKKEMYLRFA